MELTLQDTISGKKNLIGLALPIQMAVYVPSTKDANVPIDEMEVKSRVQEVSKYLAGLFGGFSSEEVVGGYISNNKELIRENVIKVVAYSTKADYEKNKRKLINKISEWAEQWSQEAIGFEFENDLYYINKSKMFKDGGSVDAEKEKEFLSGYNFKDYEDMIQTLKDAKVQKYDIGDSFDNSIDFLRLIKKAVDTAEHIVDEYKYNRRNEDSVLVINVKIYAWMDKDKAIAEATEKYKLNESQVEELESEFNDDRISQIYLDYIEMQIMDIEENFSDFIELNICKDEIFFTGNSGGYLIFQEYDFFDSMTEELTEYEDNNFTSDGEFNADDYASFEQFIQAEGRNIRKIIGLINYYEFAFSVFEAYVKKSKKRVEDYMQPELNERVFEYVLDEIKPKQKTIKKAAKKKVVEVVEETESKDDSDSYKDGGDVKRLSFINSKDYFKEADVRYIPNRNDLLIKFASSSSQWSNRNKVFGNIFISKIESLRLTIKPNHLNIEQKKDLLSLIDKVNLVQRLHGDSIGLRGVNGNVKNLADFQNLDSLGRNYLDYDDIELFDTESLRLINSYLSNNLEGDAGNFYFTYETTYDVSNDLTAVNNLVLKDNNEFYDYVLILKNEDDFSKASEYFNDKYYGSSKRNFKLLFSAESDKDFEEIKNYLEAELKNIGISYYNYTKEIRRYKDGGIAESVSKTKNSRIDEVLKGGKADSMDELALAKKHNVSLETIQKQIEKGMAFEKEHTDNVTVQREIAKDHVEEFVDYYDRLKEMEKEAEVKRTILTKNLSANKIHSIKKYLKHKGMSENDYHVYDSGTILIYSDISDTTFKEISIYIKNSLI